MVTVYKQKDSKIKYYVSIILFLLFLLVIGPICYFNGLTYLIACVTNKFFNVVINLAPLLSFFGVGFLIMYYYYFIFISRSKLKFSLSSIIIGASLLGISLIFYCINGVYLISNIRYFLFKEYFDEQFLLGFVLLLIGIAIFIIEIISFVKQKNCIASLLVDKPIVKFKKFFAAPFILLTLIFLYLVYGFILFVFLGQKINIESTFVALLLLVNIANYILFILSYKKEFPLYVKLIIAGINVLFIIFFIVLEVVHPSFWLQYVKPLCPLDYAISVPILPILICINTVITNVFIGISFLKIKIIR